MVDTGKVKGQVDDYTFDANNKITSKIPESKMDAVLFQWEVSGRPIDKKVEDVEPAQLCFLDLLL